MIVKLKNLKEFWKGRTENRKHHSVHYSISGNGVAYRRASDYLKDQKVNDFLQAAGKES